MKERERKKKESERKKNIFAEKFLIMKKYIEKYCRRIH